MDQNTAPNNNVQFQYPDFSTNANPVTPVVPQQSPTPQPSQNTTMTPDEDNKLEELRNSLNSLIQQEKEASKDVASVPHIPPKTPVDTQVRNDELEEKGIQEVQANPADMPIPESQIQTVPPLPNIQEEENKVEETYIQEPTPIPALEEKNTGEDISQLANTILPPDPDAFDPLPSDLPKFRESLDVIMPDLKKPKAMDREPKADNLSKPIKNIDDRQEDDLRGDLNISNKVVADESLKGNPSATVNKEEIIKTNGELSIQNLLAEAINRNASDLHIGVGYPPIVRIDGELLDLDEKILTPEDAEELVFSVLSDEKKELLEVNREIDFAYTFQGVSSARFRVNAYYSMKNLSAAFRLIPSRVRTIEELMLPQIYHQFAKLKQGLVLVTGPTGHGKSTTLAAILEDINRTRFCHVVTIEDPIEYVFEGKKALIDQREMNDDTHSWNIALRSALRQDPDVILVGEMRDFETIASAITLAETGHLVFATLHTNSASQTLDRIIDVFPENQQQQVRTQLANTLEAVIAQRLIPLDKGGRRAVSEIMLNNSAVSNLIREGKMHQIDNVIRTSSDIGMVYLEKSLVNLVREGVISVQKAQEYAVHPEEVLRLLKS